MSVRFLLEMAALAVLSATAGQAGPVLAPMPLSRAIDQFDGKPVHPREQQGLVRFSVGVKSENAHSGRGCLVVQLPADKCGQPPNRLLWSSAEPQDWRGFEGVVFWYRSMDTGAPHYFHSVISEANAVSYRCCVSAEPRRIREWQQVVVPFSGLVWNWEGAEDPDHALDLKHITGLRFDFPHSPAGRQFALDDVGLYKAQAPYAGPKLALVCDRYLVSPGQPVRYRVSVTDLPKAASAIATVAISDYTGRLIRKARLTFHGAAGGVPPQQQIVLSVGRLLRLAGSPGRGRAACLACLNWVWDIPAVEPEGPRCVS